MSLEKAKELYEAGNVEAAGRSLDDHTNADEALEMCHDMLMSSYWESKDIVGSIILGDTGIERCLEEARQIETMAPERAAALKKRAAIFAYNLASFCWPGWDEPGVSIGPSEITVGADCAARHRRWVDELGLGDIEQARAWWVVGAYALTSREWGDAREAFSRSASLAAAAGNEGESLLARGYGLLADTLEYPEDAAAKAELAALQARLAALEDGADLVKQIETAGSVCARTKPSHNLGTPAPE